jgi:hypothetical protein
LLPILQQALDDLGVMPTRVPEKYASHERRHQEAAELVIDGTDRCRQRPKNQAKQALHYSGKQKTHSDKNLVVVNAKTKRVGYLSQTYAGKMHDKKIVDTEDPLSAGNDPVSGHRLSGVCPQSAADPPAEKKPRKGALTRGQKRHNRKLSRIRVRVSMPWQA